MADQLVPVFVVSLREARERRSRIATHLAKLGVRFEFIDAVQGHRLTDRERRVAASGDMVGRLGALGCALSHFKVYQRMIDEHIECAMVLEDDVVLDRRIGHLLRSGRELAADYLFVGCGTTGMISVGREGVVAYDTDRARRLGCGFVAAQLSHGPFRAHAYVISLAAVTKRLSEAYPLTYPIDYYHHLAHPYIFEAVIRPQLTWLSPLASVSQIRTDGEGRASALEPVRRLLKRRKCYFSAKRFLTLSRLRRCREIRTLVASGVLPRRRWEALPWDDGEVFYADV